MNPVLRSIAALACLMPLPAPAAPVALSDVPLFLTSSTRANVLMLYGNSNSMDGNAAGAAVGSAAPTSKSEISRNAIKTIISNYSGAINIGLLAYRQHTSGSDQVRRMQLHDSLYDVSYDPANYSPLANPPRESMTKKFRVPNPSSPGNFLHFNVALPFYSSSNEGTAFCYSSTANAFNNGEHPTLGPWDTYQCHRSKTGTSDAAPATAGSGYTAHFANYRFMPTDSDLGQGITDFGKRLTWNHVSPTWFSNSSPGSGYLHIPIALLDAAQAGRLNTKMGTSQFAVNAPYDAAYPLQNAGLTPLAGSVATANRYFNGTLSSPLEGGPLPAPPESCRKNFLVVLTDGLPSVDINGTPSANVAAMLSELSGQVSALRSSAARTETYVVGFALPYGVNPAQLDTIASAGGTDRAYFADDPATLNETFARIFADIMSRTAAASSVALNSHSIHTGSRLYQARFSSADWSGQLLAVRINSDGSLGAIDWDAGQVLNSQAPGARVILTRKPSLARGIPFRWPGNPIAPGANELDLSQVAALNTNPTTAANDGRGSARLAYLRGDATHEYGGFDFRPRPVSKLGDIVDSAPTYVGTPRYNYSDSSYRAFRSAYRDRIPMIYVGGNDGMLHGFDARTGEERIAYVPSNLFAKLPQLTSRAYTHKYFVNGSPNAVDVKFGASWRTVLVGAMGAGGRGIYGLDVTDPAQFSEANAQQLVRFEFTEANDSDVGFVTGQPTVVRMNNGRFAAVFGNGFNGTGSGHAALFIVDVETGALIRKISTGVGTPATPNALANPIAIDLDGDRSADYVYAGDLQGNLWKFDVSSDNPVHWRVAFSGAPLFVAVDGGGNRQPITTTPEVGLHPRGGVMVLFGTGKYVENADITSTAPQTIYGIRDHGAVVTSNLVRQTVTGTFSDSGQTYRRVSTNPINWLKDQGWYLPLPQSGERLVTDPILHNGRIIFTTATPSTVACSYGGSSWLMELDYLGGGELRDPVFDTDGSGRVDSNDRHAAGVALRTLGSNAAIQMGFGTRDNPMETKYLNESAGHVTSVRESGDTDASRRTAWRQLQ
ncbi:MAG TPA: PilC/PilY family type IV pilus protein [Burkholderiaceae bacterium]|nr:PilC/PilY family type IV pilus protein [Burkholderiaceae bacterium]